jgi:hypothetical protein
MRLEYSPESLKAGRHAQRAMDLSRENQYITGLGPGMHSVGFVY